MVNRPHAAERTLGARFRVEDTERLVDGRVRDRARHERPVPFNFGLATRDLDFVGLDLCDFVLQGRHVSYQKKQFNSSLNHPTKLFPFWGAL